MMVILCEPLRILLHQYAPLIWNPWRAKALQMCCFAIALERAAALTMATALARLVCVPHAVVLVTALFLLAMFHAEMPGRGVPPARHMQAWFHGVLVFTELAQIAHPICTRGVLFRPSDVVQPDLLHAG